MYHPRRRTVTTSIVGLKAVTYAKISPKMMNPRDIVEEHRRRRNYVTCTVSGLQYLSFLSFSLMGLLPNQQHIGQACCWRGLRSRRPACILLTDGSKPQRPWGLRFSGTSYPPDCSFIGLWGYFMEAAAPPACSASPSTAVASWSATTLFGKALFV